jgi:hypothetical protein
MPRYQEQSPNWVYCPVCEKTHHKDPTRTPGAKLSVITG